MDLTMIKTDLHAELKTAFATLFGRQQRGEITIPQLVEGQKRLYDLYVAKSAQTTRTGRFAIETIGTFPPRAIGDLYPTRAAAQTALDRLPVIQQMTARVVAV